MSKLSLIIIVMLVFTGVSGYAFCDYKKQKEQQKQSDIITAYGETIIDYFEKSRQGKNGTITYLDSYIERIKTAETSEEYQEELYYLDWYLAYADNPELEALRTESKARQADLWENEKKEALSKLTCDYDELDEYYLCYVPSADLWLEHPDSYLLVDALLRYSKVLNYTYLFFDIVYQSKNSDRVTGFDINTIINYLPEEIRKERKEWNFFAHRDKRFDFDILDREEYSHVYKNSQSYPVKTWKNENSFKYLRPSKYVSLYSLEHIAETEKAVIRLFFDSTYIDIEIPEKQRKAIGAVVQAFHALAGSNPNSVSKKIFVQRVFGLPFS